MSHAACQLVTLELLSPLYDSNEVHDLVVGTSSRKYPQSETKNAQNTVTLRNLDGPIVYRNPF